MTTESKYKQRDAQGYTKITQAAEGSIKATSVTITTSATTLPATALTNRRRLYIKNIRDTTFYIGPSTVTKDSGYPVRQDQEVVIDVAGVTLYAIVSTGTGTAKILEIA